jgi:HPt (histidine-containing phosphotransfer) domain-containing protein
MNEHVGKPFDLKQLVQTLLRVTGFTPQPDVLAVSSTYLGLGVDQVPAPVASPVLDASAALARMGGLGSLYRRSSQEFIQGLPAQLQELQTVLETDLARCAMLAHTLKGTAAVLGAMALAQAASQLESHCKDATAVVQRQAALQALQGAAAELVPQLQALLQSWEPQSPAVTEAVSGELAAVAAPDTAAPQERQALRVALQELTLLLDTNDLTALETFATLRGALAVIPVSLLDPLEAALQDLELEAASAHCRAIASWLDTPGVVTAL